MSAPSPAPRPVSPFAAPVASTSTAVLHTYPPTEARPPPPSVPTAPRPAHSQTDSTERVALLQALTGVRLGETAWAYVHVLSYLAATAVLGGQAALTVPWWLPYSYAWPGGVIIFLMPPAYALIGYASDAGTESCYVYVAAALAFWTSLFCALFRNTLYLGTDIVANLPTFLCLSFSAVCIYFGLLSIGTFGFGVPDALLPRVLEIYSRQCPRRCPACCFRRYRAATSDGYARIDDEENVGDPRLPDTTAEQVTAANVLPELGELGTIDISDVLSVCTSSNASSSALALLVKPKTVLTSCPTESNPLPPTSASSPSSPAQSVPAYQPPASPPPPFDMCPPSPPGRPPPYES
ncbi:hypothetical protein JCM10450v2_007584 [Rhodotorula kratochvilovae]